MTTPVLTSSKGTMQFSIPSSLNKVRLRPCWACPAALPPSPFPGNRPLPHRRDSDPTAALPPRRPCPTCHSRSTQLPSAPGRWAAGCGRRACSPAGPAPRQLPSSCSSCGTPWQPTAWRRMAASGCWHGTMTLGRRRRSGATRCWCRCSRLTCGAEGAGGSQPKLGAFLRRSQHACVSHPMAATDCN